MNTEIIGIVAQVVLMVVLSYPLGKYIARVYRGKKVWTDFMKPIEGWIFRLSQPGAGRSRRHPHRA